MPIGVLALQGDFAAHLRAIDQAGGAPIEVRRPEQLDAARGLILPGGESTTFLRLMEEYGFVEAIERFHRRGRPIWGTCAGLILLAREVLDPPQPSLGLLDVTVRRNAYGRQVDSFIAGGRVRWNGGPPEPLEMVFIRAPRIVRVGEGVEVLGEHAGEPALVRQGTIWGGSFHPELSDPPVVHRRFVEEVRRAEEA
ncbi:MAG: pyridoxal 5'-phosphate synthase glutaminase subunit PdxT [Candidatus Eisenbacteria bacterium]